MHHRGTRHRLNRRTSSVRVFIAKDAATTADKAAHTVENVVRTSPRPQIGMASGSTMIGVYRSLVG